MCITNVYKHTKMTKEEIIIKITWLSLDFLFSEYLCTLVYKVYIYILVLHCLALTSGLAEFSTPVIVNLFESL